MRTVRDITTKAGRSGGMQLKIAQLILAGGIAAAGVIGLSGAASAAPPATAAAAACIDGAAVMIATPPIPADQIASEQVGGEVSVNTVIPCEVPACAQGALTTVTGDDGLLYEACVASAADVPAVAAFATVPAAAPAAAAPAPAALAAKATFVPAGQTAATATTAVLPKTGNGTVGLVIAALLVVSGSLASLLSRRKL
jgi:LPXTG-motif cell wall-anchored protein